MILCGGQFNTDFGLDKVVAGELQGAGIWPFGVSIIVFSLFIDRIGYKVAMVFSFVSYLIYTAMAFMAYQAIHGVTGDALVDAQKHGYQLLYWGSIILGPGQRQRGGLRQSHRHHHVQHGQSQMAQPPARRLAGRSGAGRPLHHRAGEQSGLAHHARTDFDSRVHFLFHSRQLEISEKRTRTGRCQLSGDAQGTRCVWRARRIWPGFCTTWPGLWLEQRLGLGSDRRGRRRRLPSSPNPLAVSCSRFSSSS